jgi:hypothetical protein
MIRCLDEIFPQNVSSLIIEFTEFQSGNLEEEEEEKEKVEKIMINSETHYLELDGNYLSEIKAKNLSSLEKEEFINYWKSSKNQKREATDYNYLQLHF